MIPFRTVKFCAFIILFGVTVLVFLPCIANDFVDWDDQAFVSKNYHIHTLNPVSLIWMATTTYQQAWHPLTWLSHAVDLSLWGQRPSFHHLMNVLLHALNTLLFCLLGLRLLAVSGASREKALVAALTAAFLFGVHPLRVESVAWISDRKDLLCAVFYLGSLLSYVGFAANPEAQDAKKKYLLSLVFCLAALMSKVTAVTLPFVMLVIDYYPLRRFSGKTFPSTLKEKAPFIILAAAAGALNAYAASGLSIPFDYVGMDLRIMNAFRAIVFYIQKSAIPTGLIPIYQLDRSVNYLGPAYLMSAFLVAAITAASVWRASRGDRLWAAVWFSYLITLAPLLGLFMAYRHSAADRYTYLPTMALWLLVGLGVSALWSAADRAKGTALLKTIVAVVVIALGSTYAIASQKQIKIWKNAETLWTYVIENSDYVPALAYFALGRASESKGQLEKAKKLYETALSLNPENPRYLGAIANIAAKEGHTEQALKIYREILSKSPGNPNAHVNVARMLVMTGKFREGVAEFEKALQIDPGLLRAWWLMVIAHLNKGDKEEALQRYREYFKRGFPPNPTLERALGLN